MVYTLKNSIFLISKRNAYLIWKIYKIERLQGTKMIYIWQHISYQCEHFGIFLILKNGLDSKFLNATCTHSIILNGKVRIYSYPIEKTQALTQILLKYS